MTMRDRSKAIVLRAVLIASVLAFVSCGGDDSNDRAKNRTPPADAVENLATETPNVYVAENTQPVALPVIGPQGPALVTVVELAAPPAGNYTSLLTVTLSAVPAQPDAPFGATVRCTITGSGQETTPLMATLPAPPGLAPSNSTFTGAYSLTVLPPIQTPPPLAVQCSVANGATNVTVMTVTYAHLEVRPR